MTNVTEWKTGLLFLLIILINPIAGISLYIIYIIIEDNINIQLLPFCLLTILFLCALNNTKVPFSDQVRYYDYFKHLSKHSVTYNFTEFKDYGFVIINYILYFFFRGNTHLYGISITFIQYSLLMYTAYLFAKANKHSSTTLLFTLILIAFIPYIFAQTSHTLRQNIAACLLCYILIEYAFYKKKKWWSMILMVSIHWSSIIFIPLFFLPFLKERISKKNFILYLGVIICLIFFKYILSNILPSTNRIELAQGYISQATNSRGFGEYLVYIQNIILFISLFFCTYIKRIKTHSTGIIYFTNFLLILLFFNIISGKGEFVVRINFYIWYLMPFIITYILSNFKFNKKVYLMASGLIISFFIYYMEYMTPYTYKLPTTFYKCPLFQYFINFSF